MSPRCGDNSCQFQLSRSALELNWSAAQWRVLDAAHQKRNLAEYEGYLEIEESAIDELRNAVAGLIKDVAKITG